LAYFFRLFDLSCHLLTCNFITNARFLVKNKIKFVNPQFFPPPVGNFGGLRDFEMLNISIIPQNFSFPPVGGAGEPMPTGRALPRKGYGECPGGYANCLTQLA
jgi:hypothetical protein